MKKIYLDHSATTPVDRAVLQAMLPYFSEKFGNASSMHSFGQEASAGVEKAREQISAFLNCDPNEVIFTSGATEANNLAIKGVIDGVKKKGITQPHIITSLIEHDAVLEPCAYLTKQGCEVTFVGVDSKGVVDVEKIKASIKDNTVLVSIMYVNSEVGTVQPIREIGKYIMKHNERRLAEWNKADVKTRGEKPQQVYFHTDATQALNYFNCDVVWNYFDLLSFSGHKIYGPKGVGALYAKTGTPLIAQNLGGHHELNRRSGTLNVPGIVGLGAAVAQLTLENIDKHAKNIAKLRDMLVEGLMKGIPDIVLNTPREIATPSHAHFSILGVEGESMLISLDMEGIAVSTGSACASGSLKASHVLLAMGIRKEVAHTSLRFTLGKYTAAEEIKEVLRKLPPIVERMRAMAPKDMPEPDDNYEHDE